MDTRGTHVAGVLCALDDAGDVSCGMGERRWGGDAREVGPGGGIEVGGGLGARQVAIGAKRGGREGRYAEGAQEGEHHGPRSLDVGATMALGLWAGAAGVGRTIAGTRA
jgi:hypothetical protein